MSVEWPVERLARETEELGGNLLQCTPCPPQISHVPTEVRTRAFSMRRQRLTAWATARSCCTLLDENVCVRDLDRESLFLLAHMLQPCYLCGLCQVVWFLNPLITDSKFISSFSLLVEVGMTPVELTATGRYIVHYRARCFLSAVLSGKRWDGEWNSHYSVPAWCHTHDTINIDLSRAQQEVPLQLGIVVTAPGPYCCSTLYECLSRVHIDIARPVSVRGTR
jgi:hypothetical protein